MNRNGVNSLAMYGCRLVCVVFAIIMVLELLLKDIGVQSYESLNTKTSARKLVLEKYDVENPNQLVFEMDQDFSSDEDNLPNSQKYDLIINTYMRSGSTFLGKIFSIRPDTFYVFEPLWEVQKFAFYSGGKKICHYSENRCSDQGEDAEKQKVGSAVTWEESKTFLNGLLDCTFVSHELFLPDARHFPTDYPNLSHDWTFGKGVLWEPYHACAEMEKSSYKECFGLMKPVCKGAKHRVMKVLRTTLDNFDSILKSRPNLKVIHLFRDPRGILNSHLYTKFYVSKLKTSADVENDIKTTCQRMRYDLKIASRLKKKFPDRFRIIQYEDLEDLLSSAKALFDFLGMDRTADLDSDLQRLIRPSNMTKGFHPFNYRETLSWNTERLIYRHCQHVIQALGYPIFSNEMQYSAEDDGRFLRNLSYPLSK